MNRQIVNAFRCFYYVFFKFYRNLPLQCQMLSLKFRGIFSQSPFAPRSAKALPTFQLEIWLANASAINWSSVISSLSAIVIAWRKSVSGIFVLILVIYKNCKNYKVALLDCLRWRLNSEARYFSPISFIIIVPMPMCASRFVHSSV